MVDRIPYWPNVGAFCSDARTMRLPTGNCVDVWLLRMEEGRGAASGAAPSLLSHVEQHIAAGIVSERERCLYVGSRILLRSILWQYTGVPPATWQFKISEFGKPSILAPQCHRQIRFNLSHANDIVACAISASSEIGVDIEYVESRRDFLGIASRFFSQQEIDALEAAGPSKACKLFYRLWTLKEAYLKAKGVGFSEALSSCRFELSPAPRLRLDATVNDDASTWNFFSDSLIDETYCMAVATQGSASSTMDVRLRWVDTIMGLPPDCATGTGCELLTKD